MSYLKERIWLQNLILICPLGKSVDNCPLNELRKMTFNKRNMVVDAMTINEVEKILVHHKECLYSRSNTTDNC